MGIRMDNLHAPTVASGPTSQPLANGAPKQQTLQEIIAEKENVEAELSALGSVLDSVWSFSKATRKKLELIQAGSTAST